MFNIELEISRNFNLKKHHFFLIFVKIKMFSKTNVF